MELWIIWIIMAAILFIIEIISQSLWCLCFGIGALFAMICSFFFDDTLWLCIAFISMSLVAYALFLPLFKRWCNKSSGEQCRTGMDALIGRAAIVTSPILPGKIGRAKIDGDSWQVCATNVDIEIKEGESVVVVNYDGNVLSVERV